MSVKFEQEKIKTTGALVPGVAGIAGAAAGRDETTAHKIGEALTGGKQNTGYLAVRTPMRPST